MKYVAPTPTPTPTPSPTPTPTPTPTASGTIILDNFSGPRLNSGTGGDIFSTYLGEDPGQTYSITNGQMRVTGSPTVGIYWHFLPYPYTGSLGWAKGWIEQGTWDANVNRLKFSFSCDRNLGKTASGYGQIQVGTYVKAPDGAPANQGAHYYHNIDPNIYTDKVVYVDINRTPQHQVGTDSNINWPENPTSPTFNYFDGLTRWYFDTENGTWSNATCRFRPVTFEKILNEPDQQVSSVTYQYTGTRYEVTWSGPKNSTLQFDIAYKTSSMKSAGFASGTAGGTIAATGNAYSNVIWASPNMAENANGMYIAIRPQGQTNFTEVYVPNSGNPVLPTPTPTPTPTPGDTIAPIFSNISASSVTTSSATITWTTNELSDSQVEYGLTTAYGSQSILNTSLVTFHSQILSNLSSGTTYHYKVKSRDAATNLGSSLDNTFTTQTAPDTQAPSTISNLSSSNIQTNSLTLSWSAPSDFPNGGAASSYDIRYSTSPITSSNFSSATQVTGEPTPASPGTSQTYILAGLNPSTHYYAAMTSRDTVGNTSVISNVVSVTTASLPIVTPTPTPTPTGIQATPTPTPTPAVCSSFTYSAFNACQPDGTQSRTTTSANPTNCIGGSPVLTQSCTYIPPVTVVTPSTCTFFNYYDWSSCQTNSTQSRSVLNASPSGCTGGSPILTQYCTYIPPYSQPTPTPPVSTIPPIAFQVLGATNQVVLKWVNPQDYNFIRAVVVRKENSSPSSPSDGITLYEGTTQEFTDTTAKPGIRYYYAIYALDRNLTPSSPTVISTYLGEKTNAEVEKTISQTVSATQPSLPRFIFTKNLKLEDRNEDVKALQEKLSVNQTGYFGPLTRQAVISFQKKYGIQTTGTVGPITRAKLNELYGASNVQQSGGTLIGPFFFGIRSAQVTLLQQYLSRNPSIYTGPITGYYGSLTTEAVKKFQKKYNIEQTGVAGPITRGKLMDLWISKP